jgi:hypothetical protein
VAEIKLNNGQTLARVHILSGLTESELVFLAQRAVPRHLSAHPVGVGDRLWVVLPVFYRQISR